MLLFAQPQVSSMPAPVVERGTGRDPGVQSSAAMSLNEMQKRSELSEETGVESECAA